MKIENRKMASPFNLTVCKSPYNQSRCVYSNSFDCEFVCIGNFVYKVLPDLDIPDGFIGMSSFQRNAAGVVVDGPVEVWVYYGSQHTCKRITVEVTCLKEPPPNIKLEDIANRIRNVFYQFILSFGQSLVMDDYLLWVKSSDSGVIRSTTEVLVIWVACQRQIHTSMTA
jgi:hypothetical protein